MNLLLTNDDGYNSPGLKALADRLSLEHKIFIVAPESNRSAVSHHFTMFSQNKIVKIEDNIFSCSGYPADCSFVGFAGDLFGEKIDAVIAGINIGANLGTDIVYSGTCAAVRETVLHGIPGIAVSLDVVDWDKSNKEGFKFNALADFTAKNLEKLISLACITYPRAFVNVNGASVEKYKGVKFTDTLCVRNYNDKIKIVPSEKSSKEYIAQFIFGENITKEDEKSDFTICRNEYVSVSVIYADPISRDVADGISFFI